MAATASRWASRTEIPAATRKATIKIKHKTKSKTKTKTKTTSLAAVAASSALLFASPVSSARQTFPYVPTTVLLSPPSLPGSPANSSSANAGIAYIFHPRGAGLELLSVNISATASGAASLQTLSTSLPFLDGATDTTAFLPTMADDGSIVVQAGDCMSAEGYDVWTYTPPVTDGTATTSDPWHKTAATLPSTGDSDAGPYALGAGISFSATLAPTMSDPVLYSYGGMCLAPTTDDSAWQANGTYTKSMLRVAPSGAGGQDQAYTATFVSGKGPAFPEAGFSFTSLSPSISNRSGVVTQQNRYVLLGGHTQQAFINMSSAAIWNLPEESWSFATVGGPRDVGSSELAVKDLERRDGADDVESRSGHTAVLNEDGTALIVLGGWVGSVSQPASPQLALLEMGDTYGDWTWSIPSQQPDDGIYGHGAAILPGNVMMVYGGYEIMATSGSKARKRQSGGTGLRFLNMTSMSWSSSYSNPDYATPSDGAGAGAGNNDNIKKIGLGVGVGVGFAAILGAFVVYFCYKRHLRKKKEARDETVRSLAQDASRFLHPDDDMMERDDGSAFPWTGHAWYTGGPDPYETIDRSLGYESLRSGRNPGGGQGGNYQPPGLLIPRKPIPRAARGAYQPPANLSTPGHIHPIYEADEDDPEHGSNARASRHRNQEPSTPTTPGYADPFMTPTGSVPVLNPGNRNSTTPSPEAFLRRDPEVQDWQSDVDAAEALLARMPSRRNSRVSPTRRESMRSARSMADDERTASNVSESARSAISVPTRQASTRHTASPGPNNLNLTIVTGADNRLGTSSSSSSSGHTYSTAKSTFNALQAEGPSLLLQGRPRPGKDHRAEGDDGGYNDDDEDGYNYAANVPGSPSKHKPRRSLGWLGSLRRVFSSGVNNESSDSGHSHESPRRLSLDQVSSDYEPRLIGLSGIGGAELLRRKQGRHDWDVDQRSLDEWDIEKAIEQRLVQVMFTVPKERLRVVNAEIEREEEVVLVDPDKDEMDGLDRLEADLEKRALVEEYSRDKGKGRVLSVDDEDAVAAAAAAAAAAAGGQRRPDSPGDGSPVRGRRLVHLPPPRDGNTGHQHPLPSREDSTEPRPSLTLRTAEVVSVARPKTRVLKMVESFESRSREGSPSLG
ncbi:Putative galactose oxidase/kelch, beta-propeller, kelch-type beta propeller [Colletotrichum destructivum]|uniref:Galactose oxidase/kelch, beta-propeller, kelch-type beta propeller n=1 Tax=Colletotrichum destructivum TaxID=34406 RepID=A0AAX4ISA5_9PEZI|nr:Putative galactose oxidase/kelch, beta-propeller, kelch-type beta propeller [Colletotrichum destructivum]